MLNKQGYEVDETRTIAEAKTAWTGGVYDLLILDVSLPDGSGYDFCRSVRQSSEVPIIFLTASDEETNVIMGLDIGGDDYVTKPFRLGILLSRVGALLRRTKTDPAENTVLESNGIRVELLRGQVFCKGGLIDLTSVEFKLLCGNTAVHALKNVSFAVPKGEFVAIVGESGSGKSTLLNMIGALDTPTEGKVFIDGKDILSMNDNAMTVFRRRNIGFIFQAFNLMPELTVEQNISFPILLDYQKPDKAYLDELLSVLI